jgi:hypothetical protein
MAVPAILGLGALSGLMGSLTRVAVTFFAARFVKKLAVLAVYIAVTYTATEELLSFLDSIAANVLSGAPAELAMIGIALPTNVGSCLSLIITTEITCLTYALTIKSLETQLTIVS